MLATVQATHDPSLTARVVGSRPLLYTAGADPRIDRPAHVRAASGLIRAGQRIAIIQDDANFVALADPATGRASAIVLPAGEGGRRQFDDVRGNKRYKLDLECCTRIDDVPGGTLVAFGSGSTDARERIVIVRGIETAAPRVSVVDAATLYAALRARTDFSGSEMNIEGAVVIGGVLRLFNRGNGAPVDGRVPVNATADLDLAGFLAYLDDPTRPSPVPSGIIQYTLGAVGGSPLTFTDATVRGADVLYAAAAEASPDATRDGPVAGAAIGILRGDVARHALVTAADGSPYTGKIEGILPHADSDPSLLLAVVDRDDPGTPSELLDIVLEGAW